MIVIGVYLLLIVAMGIVFARFNKNDSDYFRGGSQGTWWLVGSSAFMSGFSAYTFTAASGIAFEAGWSVMIIYAANAIGYLLNFLFLAPWFRQIRATTYPEVIKERFGIKTQQFYAWIGVVMSLLMAGIWLNGLAIFVSAVFQIDVKYVIVAVGLVVLLYSMTGGVWAVMGTDFLQSLILIPITILMAYLCLKAMGGWSGMSELIQTQGLTEKFKVINEPGEISMEKATWLWAIAIIIKNVMVHNTLGSSVKYFSVKDGKEARMAAALAGILMVLGAVIWIIPPMASRLLFADIVNGMDVSKPSETAYAVAAMQLLPRGMTGLMVIAMFAATMSSMDTGLNRNAAIFVRDILPAISKTLGFKQVGTIMAMRLGRIFTFIFGLCIIGLALYFEAQDGKGIFTWMLKIGAVVGIPLSVPMLMCLFIKRAPSWSAALTVSLTMIPSAIGLYSEEIFGQEWLFQTKLLVNLISGITIFLCTIPFASTSPQEYHDRVAAFFKRMHTPIDLETEVGLPSDGLQLLVVGRFAMIAGFCISLLCFVVDISNGEHWGVLFIAGTVAGIGCILNVLGVRFNKRLKLAIQLQNKDTENEV